MTDKLPDYFQRLVICRRGSDPLKPGFIRGTKCEACGLELQVSPLGLDQIQRGAHALCNPCGLMLSARMVKEGKIEAVGFNSVHALETFEERYQAWLRDQHERAARN
jgi:hypothetical protein